MKYISNVGPRGFLDQRYHSLLSNKYQKLLEQHFHVYILFQFVGLINSLKIKVLNTRKIFKY